MSYTAIDLSQLPPPQVVQQLDYEQILAERKAYLISLYPADQQASIAAILALESEPLTKLLQENAYREMMSDGMNWVLTSAIGNSTSL